MSKPPTRARGRRLPAAAPPPPPARRALIGWSSRREDRSAARASGRARASGTAAVEAVAFEDRGADRLGWRPLAVLALCLLGLADSVYVTLVHYTTAVTLSCPSTGGIDCAKVITSPQSVIFGIPVAVYGLIFFFAMTIGALPVVWRHQSIPVARARLGASVVGIGFAAYLLYTELYVLHAICLWCTGAHVMAFLVFALLVTGWEELGAPGAEAEPMAADELGTDDMGTDDMGTDDMGIRGTAEVANAHDDEEASV